MVNVTICKFLCGCHICEMKIDKGEHFLEVRRGVARINICARCIKESAKQIPEKDIQAVENRIALKELEN